MEENGKMKILSNDLIRRFLNSSKDLGRAEKERIVDGYARKLLSSGYSLEKTREIIVRGIKGYEGKLQRCKREGIPLRKTAKESSSERNRKKLLSKSTWFKKSRKKDEDYRKIGSKWKKGKKKEDPQAPERVPHKTVLFVEQTRGGGLATDLRNLMSRLAPTLKFGVKIVESRIQPKEQV